MRKTWLLAAMVGWVGGGALCATAAEPNANSKLIDSGSKWLAGHLSMVGDQGERALAALALVKCGTDPNSASIAAVAREIQGKIKSNQYSPSAHHAYEAGVDMMLLAEIDMEKYRPEMTAIRDWLLAQQLPVGAWTYGSAGDTSVTQYACLGLWTAERAGLDVPVDVWDRVLAWHAQAQLKDGGFSYIPGYAGAYDGGNANLNMTTAAIGSVMIAARHAFPGRADSLQQLLQGAAGETRETPAAVSANTPTSEGPLTKVDLSKPDEPTLDAVPEKASSKANLTAVRATVTRALGWLTPRFVPIRQTAPGTVHHMYYLYTVERTFSLTGQDKVGDHTWYSEGAAGLAKLQQPDGSWDLKWEHTSNTLDTCFALLFLSRSTGKLLNRRTPEESHGGGLLTGGKGEPVEAVAAKKDPTPLDQLLKSLQDPGALDLEQAQSELIEQVQLGDRTELIGQKEMLVKLIQHPHGEIRRTAAWALGRTNDLRLARYLVDALEDQDLGVMMEAHAAMSWLSRRFDGFGLPVNPLDDLKADASDTEKAAATEGWRVRARRNWGNWYLRVRPYADRGDEFEAKLRQRLGEK